ncbi:MAG: DUF6339 family protein [Methanimicrococcus sp.]|nr:DUF6339 family protein [Methanimicrococcus sp.]
MKLKYFSEEAYDKLWYAFPENELLYEESMGWVLDFIGDGGVYESSYSFPDIKLNYTVGPKSDFQKSQEDLENTQILYTKLKGLPPLHATNKLIWTYLSHVTFSNYVLDRWSNSRDLQVRFFATSNSSSLFDNAISRLWWYGYLSYDKTYSNPFELTKIMLMNQTICTDFIDATYSRNRILGRGVLQALKEFQESHLEEKEGITEYFRRCNKYLNRYGAVTVLDSMTSDEMKELALNFMIKDRKKTLNEK